MTYSPMRTRFRTPLAAIRLFLVTMALGGTAVCEAQAKPPATPAANPAPDVLVLVNGDTLHGKFVSAMAGKVTFHSDPLGDISVGWDKIKELHTTEKLAVLDKTVKLRGRKAEKQIPEGTVDVEGQTVTLHPESGPAPAPIPVANAQYVMDGAALEKQAFHEPGFFSGWNGAATAGASVVTATQKQYTFSGGVGLVRLVPSVAWLNPRNRTTADFSASFGKITQPGYYEPATPPATTPTYVPATVTKSSITHADAERDEFLSPRFFALGQTAFDHNYSQDLNLQQIYGGGMGWTFLKTPKQEASLKGTVQFERQQFISGSGSADQNLVGSTFSISYLLHTKLVTYTQGLAFVPAWNVSRAYAANEADTFVFPAYKNLSFSLGTMDSYLNDPPSSLPPTKRNSFQFTMGLTYAFKSKY